MESNNFIAVDLGASSGRVIVSSGKNCDVIHRFDGYLKNENDSLVWDVDFIYKNILVGLKEAVKKYHTIKSLAIDSWGVDYVLLNNDKVITPVYAYRDKRTIKAFEEVHKVIPQDVLYARTGIQINQINTIYQLKDDLDKHRLDNATDFLHLPEYFSYLLTGKKVKEYTMATTTGLIDLNTEVFSDELIDFLKFPKHLFPKLVMPGTLVGDLKEEVKNEIGANIPVVMCASHDTASAFEMLDVDLDSVIISSGTWSLTGVKIPRGNNSSNSYRGNFTNEGGVNYIRYLKNIMGLWIFNEVRKKQNHSFSEIDQLALSSTYNEVFDVNDNSLLSPSDMKEAILALLKNNPPKTDGDLYRSIFRSLATSYANVCNELERNLRQKFNRICIVGGGAKNEALNRFTKEITHREVIAIPLEATALGNIKVQKERK